jgi:hypothetical protein
MPKKAAKKPAPPKKGKPPVPPSLRPGGERLHIFNSGLEVWLYDEGSMEEIRASGGMDFRADRSPRSFGELTAAGLVVGYSLYQDDELDIEVIVGKPLTTKELAVGRWLEPQSGFLRLPTGKLCVESNDASRIGPEDPTDKGATLALPPGEYKVTLYRVDHEQLDREGIAWKGPQEVVVLTPGGTPADAAEWLIPYELRRDLSWVGKYSIKGKRVEGLAWFADYWDTYLFNLDAAGIAKLGLKPGMYVRTTCPTVGISLVTVFANKWEEGRKLPLPQGVDTSEYGYGSLSPMGEWNGAEALFCKRDSTKTLVDDPHQNLWLPATLELLDAAPRAKVTPEATQSDLATKTYFDDGYLTVICSEVIPGAGDLDTLPLPEGLKRLDALFGDVGLDHLVDFSWIEDTRGNEWERTARLYVGRDEAIGAIIASEGRFDLFFLTELPAGGGLVTGMVDDFHVEIKDGGNKQILVQNLDEALSAIWEAHEEKLQGAKGLPVSQELTDRLKLFERFMKAVRP